jgi:dipeptidyl aminopeptidase/acylaminoacyl peptidase
MRSFAAALLMFMGAGWTFAPQGAGTVTVEQVLGYPSPENLVASPAGSAIAWTFNERGVRNVYVAEGPAFEARKLTAYTQDDGQELTQLSFTKDGRTLVYVRGGDHGGRPGDGPPNPSGNPVQPKIQIWAVPVRGGVAKLVAEGDSPAIAPDSDRIAFVRERRIWLASISGSGAPQALFYARGNSDSAVWSPDGKTLAFVSDRTDHSFIGLFTPGQAIRFVAPSTSRDTTPVWSPDGSRIAFLRQPGVGGTPQSPLVAPLAPWALMVARIPAGTGGETIAAEAVMTSGEPVDRIVQSPGGLAFRWAARNTLVFMSYRGDYPHIYALAADSRVPRALTSGSYMVEQMTLTPDGNQVIYSANTGTAADDVARRHLFRVPVDGSSQPEPLTAGMGIEWGPVITADGRTVAFLQSFAQKPPAPAVVAISGGTARTLAANLLPANYPSSQMVAPQQVSFRASDGVEAFGQLFTPNGGLQRKPAIIYIHGGGPRQMLLGFHNRWEYAMDYAANQYLVSRGFIVLSVDYRLSVGYGKAFQFPENAGPRGASEYRDILAAGRYLQSRPDVDGQKIGVWGASLGGYLTALALGRNSDVFAAGVDVHGAHDRLPPVNPTLLARAMVGDGLTEEELRHAMQVQFESSPVAAVSTWKSPVLMIHGDDDRIVEFRQSIDLKRRLEEKGVHVEELVLPDDVHDSLLWRNWVATIKATGDFFERMLRP